MRVTITKGITRSKQKIYKHNLTKSILIQFYSDQYAFRYWMILTFGFKFLKKIKKGEAYYIFILYILIFCSFASKKSQFFQGFTE